MEPISELLQPPSPGSFVWFSLICSRGERLDSAAAAVTLHTVADESRNKMAVGVARSPSRLCINSRDGKIYCYEDALSINLFCLLLCFASYFSFFLSFLIRLFPPSRYVYLLRVPSSVEQPSATLSKYVFYTPYNVPGTTCAAPYVVQARFLINLNVSFFLTTYDMRV